MAPLKWCFIYLLGMCAWIGVASASIGVFVSWGLFFLSECDAVSSDLKDYKQGNEVLSLKFTNIGSQLIRMHKP